MALQIWACIASEAMTKLGLAPAVAPAKTTPEEALRLDLLRRRRHRGEWQFGELDPDPTRYVAKLREEAPSTVSKPLQKRNELFLPPLSLLCRP